MIGQHIEPGNPLFGQEKRGMRILFQKNGSQDVTDADLLLFRGSDMVDRPLNDPLKPNGLLKDILTGLPESFPFFL